MSIQLRWLAGLMAGIAAGTAAQQLDLRLPKVTEGVVSAIRQINTGSETALAPLSGSRHVCSEYSIDQGPLVCALV